MEPQEYRTITCAHCKHIATHHNMVKVFSREQDASLGHLVVVDAIEGGPVQPGRGWGESGVPRVTINDADTLENNPSRRRHGVSIRLWCEKCSKESWLTIAQHKGTTMIMVVPTEPMFGT